MPALVHRRPTRVLLMPTDHLSAVDVAAFIDRTMPSPARERAETHLADCAQCREEVAACARLVATTPPKRRAVPWTWLGVAAAAAIAFVVVARPRADTEERGEPVAPGHPTSTPALVMPSDAIVRRSDLRFMWRSDGAGTTYRVIVVDVNGAPTWTSDMSDTTTVVSASTRLDAGKRYFWRVEALHSDGTVAKSQMLSFTIAP